MFVTFLTCQHLAWLRVSCQHLFICTSGDFNQRWVGNCTGLCMIQWSEFGTVPHSPPCFSVDGQQQRHLYLCPLWEGKTGFEYALVCKAGLQDMSPHAAYSFPSNSNTQIPANHLSVRVQGCHELWASVIQPPSQLVLTGLQVSAVGLHNYRNQEAERYLARSLLCQAKQPMTHCFPHRGAWRWIEIPCFPHMYFSVWTHAHYSNTSSPIRPYRSHRS